MTFHKIGIIGLGLIGGSILKGLEGKIEIVRGDLGRLNEIDALILAVPISDILEIGEKISRIPLSRPLVVFDVGSVKGEIARSFEKWTKGPLEFVATHPMAGKEQSGFEHSDPRLFQGASWVVAPHKKNSEAVLLEVEAVIRLLGAHPLRIEAETHDRRAALVSHVPYILSKALLDFVAEEDPRSIEMGGPGFKSMTRLGRGDPTLQRQIGIYNKKNIEATLKKLIEFLERLK